MKCDIHKLLVSEVIISLELSTHHDKCQGSQESLLKVISKMGGQKKGFLWCQSNSIKPIFWVQRPCPEEGPNLSRV